MIDLNLLRSAPDTFRLSLKNRNKPVKLLDDALNFDAEYRTLLKIVEELHALQNTISKSVKGVPTPEQITQGKEIKTKLKGLEEKLKTKETELNLILEEIPNTPADDVPVGPDETGNVVIKTVGQKPVFDFTPLDHQDLGLRLNIIDKDKAGELSGARFGYYKNEGAILEMAIMFYAIKKISALGFQTMLPPLMVKSRTEWGCGYTSNKNLMGAYYSVPDDDLIFISSSEHSVVPYHQNEILSESVFPLKYVNFSPCFRRESGTYGKDMKGMLRVHHFNKVEMNVFTLPDLKISDAMQLEMLSVEEEILSDFGLHYQVLNCCTGDLPQPNRRMYDINCWFPGLDAYKETGSCSNCADYQARRLNTKVKINGKNEFVHILNSTAVSDRAMLAIMESFQTKDASINIPDCLQSLTGFSVIKSHH
ncbi:MAG: Serine-tRNA ligase [Microgenomates group bacterium GW2011_GWA2_40_6]|nr:MAG: Serine-tRNA ligase [Microgenomates group bacterium GW2011_GWA2_40_6]